MDTTAAGDAFSGALALGLAEKRELPEAIKFANLVASVSVTVPGAQNSLPNRSDLESFDELYGTS